jgi:hypothetical protein
MRGRMTWSIVALCLGLAACDALAAFEPQFTNNTDDLQFQITGPGVSGSRDVTWQNTGTLANVNQASQLIGGTGSFTIRDANGTLVYGGNLANNGSFVSSPAGAAGAWTIHVEANNLSGTVSVRVQRSSGAFTPQSGVVNRE